MRQFTAEQTRLARAAAQGLDGRATSVLDAVRRVVALQAQDARANRLAVRVRTRGLTAADVDAAVADRCVVRTWAMRGTLHMLAAADFGWVSRALGPYFAARGAPRRRRLGLDDRTLDLAAAAFGDILAEPLTRAELLTRLADHGVVLDPRSQAPAHLLAWAAHTGLVCRGPDGPRDEPTYVLVEDWLGRQPATDPEDALATLAARYLLGYGPATPHDLAAWSGLPVGRVRPAIEAVGDPVSAAGTDAYVLGDIAHAPGTRLLGHFDAYLLGYRGRELAVPDRLAARVWTGGGFVMPAVLVDGLVVGTWRYTAGKDEVVVRVDGDRKVSGAVDAEVADLGRFLDTPVSTG